MYPYVKKGTVRVDARPENCQKSFADFSPTTGTDTSTTNLLSVEESTPTIIGTTESQSIKVGEKLTLNISAEPGTAGKGLSYQWYKNNNTPVLTSQTSKMELSLGDIVTLSVNAISSLATNTLTYEWYHNDSQLELHITGKEQEGESEPFTIFNFLINP